MDLLGLMVGGLTARKAMKGRLLLLGREGMGEIEEGQGGFGVGVNMLIGSAYSSDVRGDDEVGGEVEGDIEVEERKEESRSGEVG